MDIDTSRVRELLNKRDEIDAELAAAFSGANIRKNVKCGACGEEGHTARTCKRPFGKSLGRGFAGCRAVIQALDVDRAKPWANGQDRQEDQALPL